MPPSTTPPPGRRSPVRRPPPGSLAAVPLLAVAAALLAAACTSPAARAPAPVYRVYVANESSDRVDRVRFRPGEGAELEKSIPVGVMPGDLDGAHGLRVGPEGRFWYLTTAHGSPFGQLWKFRAGEDRVVGRDTLGLFPATVDVTPDGSEAWVVNFNLHGDPEPSTVSVAATAPVPEEVARVGVCVRPHGSRIGPEGERHYSVCGPDDRLTEISTLEREVTRTLTLPSTRGDEACSPSWAEPGVGGDFVYVACNGASVVYEVALGSEELEVVRRFPTGPAPYNLEAVPGGRWLLATNKGGASVSVLDLEAGAERKRVPTTRPVTHGVVASPDGRFAFVSNEARGGERSTVDVIDLREAERVASVEVGLQAGGIDFWRVERPRRFDPNARPGAPPARRPPGR